MLTFSQWLAEAMALPEDSLHHAAQSEEGAKLIGKLITHGANPNTPHTHSGWTPMHYAAYTLNLPAINELLKHGADINKLSRDGRTPLDETHSSRHMVKSQDITTHLIKNGAKYNYWRMNYNPKFSL